MKEYIVYSMDGVVTDRVKFFKLEEALVYGNTMRQAGWNVTIWKRSYSEGGDKLVRPLEVGDINVTKIEDELKM